jgi:hypothetical protein
MESKNPAEVDIGGHAQEGTEWGNDIAVTVWQLKRTG